MVVSPINSTLTSPQRHQTSPIQWKCKIFCWTLIAFVGNRFENWTLCTLCTTARRKFRSAASFAYRAWALDPPVCVLDLHQTWKCSIFIWFYRNMSIFIVIYHGAQKYLRTLADHYCRWKHSIYGTMHNIRVMILSAIGFPKYY